MKKIIILMSVFMCMYGAVASACMPEQREVVMEGRVVFHETYTLTCLAIGCPPSQHYFYVELLDATSADGSLRTAHLHLEDVRSDFNLEVKPEMIRYNGINIRENDLVRVKVGIYGLDIADNLYPAMIHSFELL